MTERELRTDSSTFNSVTEQNQLWHEKHNTYTNRNRIIELIKEGRAKDISNEPKKNGEPCFLISSGPSLDLALPKLKKWNGKGGVICTPSHAITLVYYGVKIDYIVVLDPFCEWAELAGYDWSKTDTKLVVNPGVWPDLIEHWPNEILLYRQSLGKNDTFFATEQNNAFMHREPTDRILADPAYVPGQVYREAKFEYLIITEITSFACSPPFQMFIADFLQYGILYLAGFDFGYTYGKERFTKMYIKEPGRSISVGNADHIELDPKWESKEYQFEDSEKIIMSNNGIPSETLHLYYKKNFYSAWRLCLKTIYRVDEQTVCHEIPFIDIDSVLDDGLISSVMTPELIMGITDKYLAEVGAFVLECNPGYTFIESKNPFGNGGSDKGDIVNFIENEILSRYICNKCNFNAKIMPKKNRLDYCRRVLMEILNETKTDDKIKSEVDSTLNKINNLNTLKNYNGLICPHCNSGHLYQPNKIDIGANVKRIKSLFNDV
ncbi:MAG TPA: 6-hydroxymethylpterin diphosphokinase MptE-like protein [Candidatus Nitrosocosmicus sp.]|nr:6-hydroxymethylpterin diphosphokinase MptE-like protein [Candidatus Nitrosocosmicus sp.]